MSTDNVSLLARFEALIKTCFLLMFKVDKKVLAGADIVEASATFTAYTAQLDPALKALGAHTAKKADEDLLLQKRRAAMETAIAEMYAAEAALGRIKRIVAGHIEEVAKAERREMLKAEDDVRRIEKRITRNLEAISDVEARLAAQPHAGDRKELEASNLERREKTIPALKTELEAAEKIRDEKKASYEAAADSLKDRDLAKELKAAETAFEKKTAAVTRAEKSVEVASRRSMAAFRRLTEATNKAAELRGKLPEMIKLVRKTIDHLKNRQAAHERKLAMRAEPIQTQTATEPSGDEYVLTMARNHGLPIMNEDDLKAARELFTATNP